MRRESSYSIRRTKPVLEVVSGDRRGSVFELAYDNMSIGRTIDNHIQVDSEAVSRCHAYVIRYGSAWMIRDNASKNGIAVNGVSVPEKQLRHGDLVQVGTLVFRFLDAATEPSPSVAVDQAGSGLYRPYFPVGAAGFGSLAKPKESSRIALYSGVIGALSVVVWWNLGRGRPEVTLVKKPSRSSASTEPLVAVAPGPTSFVPPQVLEEAPVKKVAAVVSEPEEKPKALPVPGRMDEKQELAAYLSEGLDFLKRGEFESAANAFHFAIVIDPQNATAMKGLKAAEYKEKDIDKISLDTLPSVLKPKMSARERKKVESEKRARIRELITGATKALNKKRCGEAIELAEQARRIEVKGSVAYLNEAKQIIDKARRLQKEEYEPFLVQAKEKFAEGDYSASRDLCQEMLNRDPSYREAKDCVTQAANALDKDKSKVFLNK